MSNYVLHVGTSFRLAIELVLLCAALLLIPMMPVFAKDDHANDKDKNITGYGEFTFGQSARVLPDLGYSDTGLLSDSNHWIKWDSKNQEYIHDIITFKGLKLSATIIVIETGDQIDAIHLLINNPLKYGDNSHVFSTLREAILEKYASGLIVKDTDTGDSGVLEMKDKDGDVIHLYYPAGKNSVDLFYLSKSAALRELRDTSAENKL
jgi:hypothetical protein